MKNINTLIVVNRLFVVLTVVLYIIVLYGLMAQFVLGAFQVLTGFGLLFFWKRLTTKHRTLLKYYWLSIGIYFGLLYSGVFSLIDKPWLDILVIPGMITFYFTYVLESFRMRRRNVFSLN